MSLSLLGVGSSVDVIMYSLDFTIPANSMYLGQVV